MLGYASLYVLLALAISSSAGSSISISSPSFLKQGFLVNSNFFGISIELSIIDTLIGENVSSIPHEIENYFKNIKDRAGNPLRVRIGGNSMDDSIYNANQSNMINFTTVAANINDQPVSFGPVLFDVLSSISNATGGVEYLIGVPLAFDSKNDEPLLVSTAKTKLGASLDALLLGNEPDLYGPHGQRPSNYSEADYFSEFASVSEQLNSSATYGDLLPKPLLSGPGICCDWDLLSLLNAGFLADFASELKYINLQHYPQNNCGGPPKYNISYYLNHSNVIDLARWQSDGVNAASNAGIPVILSEWSSASCGGIPGISDTFAATMWSLDYALQLASVGYTGAFIHTREQGITYNLFDPPAANATSSNWTTNAPYYALLAAAEALKSDSEASVLDFNLRETTVAGYTVFDSKSEAVNSLVLFNYADSPGPSVNFTVGTTTGQQALVRTLAAPSLREKHNISWGGETLLGVGDGTMVKSGFAEDKLVSCGETCDIEVPSPGVAVVWLNASTAPAPTPTPTGTKNGGIRTFGSASAHNQWEMYTGFLIGFMVFYFS